MKSLSVLLLALFSTAAFSAEIYGLVGISSFRCHDLYDVFQSDDVCFRGAETDVFTLKSLGLQTSFGIEFLEGQVVDQNNILIFALESGVEQMVRIRRCR